MNVQKFKGKIVEKNTSVAEVARARGEHPSTLYRKLNKNGITVQDAEFYTELLGLSGKEAKDIFLSK